MLVFYFLFLFFAFGSVCLQRNWERGGKEMRKFLIASKSLFYVMDNGVEFSLVEYLSMIFSLLGTCYFAGFLFS